MVTNQSASDAGSITERFAEYICNERIDDIDDAAIERTKQILAYHIGLAFRAIKNSEPDSLQAVEIAHDLSENCGSSTLIGHRQKTTLVDAAFANCTMMRGERLDDVIFPAGIHPGLMTLPVALGVAERIHASGADMITAIITGYELLGKFGQFTWAIEIPRRPTMPFGPFGSVAVAAKILKLTHAQTVVALAYAAHTAMGLAENSLGPITHYYSLVCRNAITGAFAAKAGAWGSPTVIEGKYGFIDSFLGSVALDESSLISSLGSNYAVLETCEKRYPGTALNQVVIELMRGLIEKLDLGASDIRKLSFTMPIGRKKFEAGHEMGPFSNPGSAASAFTFHCAILLLDGEQNPARFDDYANSEIQSLVDKMTVEFVADKPIRYSKIELQTNDGNTHIAEGDSFKFSPQQNKMVLERDAAGVISQEKIDRAVKLLDDLEHVDDVSDLMRCLVP